MEHHPLIKEFPKHKDKIHKLKIDNNYFRKLTFEYKGIDKAIVRAEQEIENQGDVYLENLKKSVYYLKIYFTLCCKVRIICV